MADAAGGVRVGSILAGKYRIERVLGEGGMGVVVAATNLMLEQPVAIKLVRPETLGRPEIISRMMREAQASAKLKSEHVVRVLDVSKLDDGTPFIVMEYLEGMDLGQFIEAHGPMPVPIAVDYVLQACDAIAEAHARGIVHRDLKPANLFLTTTAHGKRIVKVLDFGIAKSSKVGELTLTGVATVMGSPAFMSPEQLRSAHTVDGRSDVWSLGVILWQLITGAVPFSGDSFTELCVRIAVDPTPPMPKVPGGNSALEAVLRRALEKDPVERFPTVVEFAQALAPHTGVHGRQIAERLLAHAATAQPGSVDITIDSVNGQRAFATGNDPSRRRLVRGILIASVIAGLSVGALILAMPKDGGGTVDPAKAPLLTPEPPPPTVTPLPMVTPPVVTPPVVTPPPVVVNATPDAAPAETPPPVVINATPDAGVVVVTPPEPPPTALPPDAGIPAAVTPPPGPPDAGPTKPRKRPRRDPHEEVDPFKSSY